LDPFSNDTDFVREDETTRVRTRSPTRPMTAKSAKERAIMALLLVVVDVQIITMSSACG
jgi:hypothetical protein